FHCRKNCLIQCYKDTKVVEMESHEIDTIGLTYSCKESRKIYYKLQEIQPINTVCPKISCLVAGNLRFDVVFLFCSFFLQSQNSFHVRLCSFKIQCFDTEHCQCIALG
ncbi:hypothetical protein L9F63_004293, partial [Diploptera punctata]